MGICPTQQWVEKLPDGPPGIHVQTMENRRTLAPLLSHMLPFLPVPHGKASGCCRARRGSCRQTRKEVRNQRRQHESLFAIGAGNATYQQPGGHSAFHRKATERQSSAKGGNHICGRTPKSTVRDERLREGRAAQTNEALLLNDSLSSIFAKTADYPNAVRPVAAL
jgi:hypothetical protein